MNNKGYSNIPRTLCECITFLAEVLLIRSVPTFIELLVGGMLTQAGFVTEAWLAIKPVRSWGAYYKWLEHGKWSWVALGIQLLVLLSRSSLSQFGSLYLMTLLSTVVPKRHLGALFITSMATKPIVLIMPLGQCWVTMALSITTRMKHSAIPLLSRLMRAKGNTSKLDAAKTLIRVIAPVFNGHKIITLVDSWYMKWPYLRYVLEQGLFYWSSPQRHGIIRYPYPYRKEGKAEKVWG